MNANNLQEKKESNYDNIVSSQFSAKTPIQKHNDYDMSE